MKFVKFGILALSLGLFVASCGDSASKTEEGATTDTTATVAEPVAPTADTMQAAPAADTTMTPAADTTKATTEQK